VKNMNVDWERVAEERGRTATRHLHKTPKTRRGGNNNWNTG